MDKNDLRSIAEDKIQKEKILKQESLEKLTLKEVNLIVHDLRVHQIELEMQNEELKRTYLELDDVKARYFDLYDLAPEGYLIVTEKGLIIESNLTAATMLGFSRAALLKQRLSIYIHKDDQDIYYLHRKRLFELLTPEECEIRILKSDGTMFWGHMRGIAILEKGQPTCRIILSDITERKLSEKALAESEEKYRLLYTCMDQGLALHEIILDEAGKPIDYIFLDINDCYTRLLGITREMCIGKRVKEFLPNVEQYWIDTFGKVALSGEPTYYENYLETTGKYYSTYSYCPKHGQFAVLVSDITERIIKEEEINYLSYHDQLTGLYNRRFYEEELSRLDTERNLPLTIAMGDVNGLKLINDSFGHQIGDNLLKKIAEILKKCCRADDIIARIGGDEFVIILPKTDTAETEKVVARIKNMSAKKKVGSLDISISFGYETKTDKKQKIQDIFKESEEHMYRHKLYESYSTRSKMIDVIMNTLYEKNNREQLHSKRVSEICEEIATIMNYDMDDIKQIKIAGLMHDIGKIGIDEKVLNSTCKLDESEWKEIKRHPEIGYRLLSSVNEFSEIAVFALDHHERWDGKGYPKGIAGEKISIPARIIAIADAYDAMTSERTYKKILNKNEALKEIERCSGTQFDPMIAKIFVDKYSKK
jgi:diguanylate cyclase (GGDEF)-like protein/PAS domain S-box-containing protein